MAVRSPSPGSPPDLTDSKSSKSSSYHSSSIADAVACDLSNFEDISLADVNMPSAWPAEKHPMGIKFSRPSIAPSLSHMNGNHSRSLRDLTSSSKPARLSLPHPANSSRQRFHLPVPGPRSARPRPPPFRNMDELRRNRSLSPSAVPRRNLSPSPHSGPPSGSSGFLHFPGSPVGKKPSWHAPRKTIKELEDEYHDSDDDLPDDAVVWNVPLSPRPPQERELRRSETDPSSLPPSSLSSDRGDESPVLSNALERTDSDMSTASAPASLATETNQMSLKSPSLPSLPQSPGLTGNKTRAAVLSDLCTEARDLTAALEEYAAEAEQRREAAVQSGALKPQEDKAPSPSSVALPPVRRNDPLLDPLPASKEKARHLTRTRPSWLPPKSQREERRHLQQFREMMAAAAEAERRRERQEQRLQAERDAVAAECARRWEQDVLPRWDELPARQAACEICWAGVPPRCRADVWARAAGNELGLTADTFEAALKRADDAEADVAALSGEQSSDGLAAAVVAVRAAAERAWPQLNMFQEGKPLHAALVDVGRAFAGYRGTAPAWVVSLAALLLLNLPAPAAFIALANHMHRPVPAALLTSDPSALAAAHDRISGILGRKLPRLHAHLTTLSMPLPQPPVAAATPASEDSEHDAADAMASPGELPPPEAEPAAHAQPEPLLPHLLTSLLTALVGASPAHLPVDAAARVADVALLEGDVAYERAVAAALARLEGRLYGGGAEVLREVAGSWGVEADELVAAMREML
jgi:hypothetical protein